MSHFIKRFANFDQSAGVGFVYIMCVDAFEFGEVEFGGSFADMFQIKPFDGLGGGDDFIVAVAPAEA